MKSYTCQIVCEAIKTNAINQYFSGIKVKTIVQDQKYLWDMKIS
jgi:hypothetical protein